MVFVCVCVHAKSAKQHVTWCQPRLSETPLNSAPYTDSTLFQAVRFQWIPNGMSQGHQWTFILSFKKCLLSPFFVSGIVQCWVHSGEGRGLSWHGLPPWLLHVRITRKLRNRSVKTLTGCQWVHELGGGWSKERLCGFPVIDPEPGSTKLETKAPSSVEGRSLNPQVQKKQKEDFGGRLFPQVLCSSTSLILTAGYCSILFYEYATVYSSSVSGHLVVSNFCLLQIEL